MGQYELRTFVVFIQICVLADFIVSLSTLKDKSTFLPFQRGQISLDVLCYWVLWYNSKQIRGNFLFVGRILEVVILYFLVKKFDFLLLLCFSLAMFQ